MRDVEGAEDNAAGWTLAREAERGVKAASKGRSGSMPVPAGSRREGGEAGTSAAKKGPGRRDSRSEPASSASPERPHVNEPIAAQKDREDAEHNASAAAGAPGRQ